MIKLIEADFIQGLHMKNEKKLAIALISRSMIQMISFSLNNFKLGDYVDRIYSIEIDISDRPALNLDVH